MKNQAKTFPIFGYELTEKQLSMGLLALGGIVAFCLFSGFHWIGISLTVATALGVLLWAVHLHELSEPPAVRYAQMRRIVQLRRGSDSENTCPLDTPIPVVIILGCIVVVFCGWNLLNAYTQYSAKDYPSVIGLMTRYVSVDIGMVSSALEVEYEYTVGGQNFRGQKFRFLYRPYRVGTDDAKLLAANWQQAARIPVFYDPDHPAKAVIDNTFCKGDQLFVGLNVVGIIAAFLAVGTFGYFRWLITARRELRVETDATRNVEVMKLSNVPFYGMFGLAITSISFFFLIVGLVGGLVSMGNVAVDWLVLAIDWMYAVTGGLLTASLFCCAAERISHGRRGRTCEIDTFRKQITVQPEGFAEAVTMNFDQIDSIRVVSSRDSWVRFGRTFSPTIFYRDHAGSNAKVILQRNLNRNQAIDLTHRLRGLLGRDRDAGSVGTRSSAQTPIASICSTQCYRVQSN